MKTNNTQLLHVRNKDDSGKINRLGGVTIAYQISDDNQVHIGFAICRSNENYSKKIGLYGQFATEAFPPSDGAIYRLEKGMELTSVDETNPAFYLRLNGKFVLDNLFNQMADGSPFADKDAYMKLLLSHYTNVASLSKGLIDKAITNSVFREAQRHFKFL